MSTTTEPLPAKPAAPAGPPAPAASSAWGMYRAMVGIGLICGLLIVLAFQGTKPVIARNRAAALEKAIFRVLPEARSRRTFEQQPDGRFTEAAEGHAAGPAVHAGYGEDGKLVGFALEAQGMGYQDVVKLLYGYAPEKSAVVGVQILESRETPGLGDKAGTDPVFLKNFEALDASLTPDGKSLAHPVVAVKHGEKTDPWQVDSITGATITSKAVANILNGSLSTWAPLIREHAADFAPEGSAP